MVLRAGDFVSVKANWEPKVDNIRQMAAELRLGIDSFVFVDDNPAEIEIVRQFAPTVTTVSLSGDPADYSGQLQDCRLFEPHSITSEDARRTGQYREESEHQTLLASAADMDAYLESLAMEMMIREFMPVLHTPSFRERGLSVVTERQLWPEVLGALMCQSCFLMTFILTRMARTCSPGSSRRRCLNSMPPPPNLSQMLEGF